MKVLVGAVSVILAAASLGATAGPQRYVPFKLVAGGEEGIDMNKSHPRHAGLYVVANRAGRNRILQVVNAEDRQAIRQVDLRKSIIVVAAHDFSPQLCPKSLTIRRLRVHRGRLSAKGVVEVEPSCSYVPETKGVHLYSVAALARTSVKKAPKPTDLRFVFTGP